MAGSPGAREEARRQPRRPPPPPGAAGGARGCSLFGYRLSESVDEQPTYLEKRDLPRTTWAFAPCRSEHTSRFRMVVDINQLMTWIGAVATGSGLKLRHRAVITTWLPMLVSALFVVGLLWLQNDMQQSAERDRVTRIAPLQSEAILVRLSDAQSRLFAYMGL